MTKQAIEIPQDNTIKRILKYVFTYKINMIFVLFLSTISSVVNIMIPRISGKIITLLSDQSIFKNFGTTSINNFDEIFKLISILFSFYSISALSTCICNYIMTGISIKITYNLREDISKKISSLNVDYLSQKKSGEIISYITNDVEILSSTLTDGITQIITSLVMFLGTLYMMFYISWQLSVITIIFFPLTLFFISLVVSKAQKSMKIYQDNIGLINGHIEEMYSGHEVIKAFSIEKISINQFEKFNKITYESSLKSEFLMGLVTPITIVFSNINYIIVCVIGGYLVTIERLFVGDIASFMVYSSQFKNPFLQLVNIPSTISQTIVSAKRIFDFLDTPSEICSRPPSNDILNTTILSSQNRSKKIIIPPSITFKNVTFSYGNTNIPVINDLSLEIPSGKTVAIVGSTGSGKSTLIKLLLKFYNVNLGDILINGNSIYKFNNRNLRNMFGVVLQDTWLYSDSILENIRYSNINISDEKILDICKCTGIDYFINTLSDGYQTILNESSNNISHGQKQLISIVRTLITDPDILILDEATSTVDTLTEKNIQKTIKKISKNRTSIIIAHRLSTIESADIVVVMHNGKIKNIKYKK